MDDFRIELHKRLLDAAERGWMSLKVDCKALHQSVGGYPAAASQMPLCCQAMREEMRDGDEIVAQSPEDRGASLVIRYRLPR